jgi:tRNA dimethylallyltransferase
VRTEFIVENKLLVIAGPTASGKSALAAKIAESFAGVVINADSMQVYQGVPVLTAQPSPAEQVDPPHRLYGVIAPDSVCSAGHWRSLAAEECRAAWEAGRLPVVVGGSGLYIRSLIEGLSPIPDVPAAVRDESRALFASLGNRRFYDRLNERDPLMAAKLDPSNSQRLMRAWEVLAATGKSLALWQAEPRQGSLAAHHAIIALAPPRADLYQACDRRLEAMLGRGALEEVTALRLLRLDPGLPVMKALGVAEFSAYLDGACDLEVALRRAQQATRNYAKRQMTWFRNQIIPQITIEEKLSESEHNKIIPFIRQFLLTAAA